MPADDLAESIETLPEALPPQGFAPEPLLLPSEPVDWTAFAPAPAEADAELPEPATSNRQPATGNREPAIGDQQPAASFSAPADAPYVIEPAEGSSPVPEDAPGALAAPAAPMAEPLLVPGAEAVRLAAAFESVPDGWWTEALPWRVETRSLPLRTSRQPPRAHRPMSRWRPPRSSPTKRLPRGRSSRPCRPGAAWPSRRRQSPTSLLTTSSRRQRRVPSSPGSARTSVRVAGGRDAHAQVEEPDALVPDTADEGHPRSRGHLARRRAPSVPRHRTVELQEDADVERPLAETVRPSSALS